MQCAITSYGESKEPLVSIFIDKDRKTIYSVDLCKVQNIKIGECVLANDRYVKYEVTASASGFMNVINNPKSSDLTKHCARKKYIDLETPEEYAKNSNSINRSDKTWVYNILDGKAESDRILFQNDNFVVLPDTRWNPNDGNTDDLYFLAIIKNRHIKSIRDLTGNDIPLLEDMAKKIPQFAKQKYGINEKFLRMYFHYKPSTWHLHLHINNINSSKTFSSSIEHAHSIFNVINNLKADRYFYRTATLEVVKNLD